MLFFSTFCTWYCNLGQDDHSLIVVPDNSEGTFNKSSYQNDQISQWIIKSASSQQLKIEFLFFDVEEGLTCSYDSLTIITDDHDGIVTHGKFCYDQPTIRGLRNKPASMPFLRNFSPPVQPVIDSLVGETSQLESRFFYGTQIRLILASDSAVTGDGFSIRWRTLC